MKKLIDTHCHIYKEFYDNINEIVENYKASNVDCVFNCADSYNSALEVIELSKKYDSMYPVVGIHPEELSNINVNELNDVINRLENLIKTSQGIGNPKQLIINKEKYR